MPLLSAKCLAIRGFDGTVNFSAAQGMEKKKLEL
jgi:hypothetical protein